MAQNPPFPTTITRLWVHLLVCVPILASKDGVDQEGVYGVGYDEGGVGCRPQGPDGLRCVWVSKDNQAVLDSQHVGHPLNILLMAVLGLDIVVSCDHRAITLHCAIEVGYTCIEKCQK